MNANELIATDWQGSDLIEEWEVPESFLLIAFADKVMREMRSESLTRVDPSAYFVAIAGPQDARRFHLPQALRPLMNSGIAKTILFDGSAVSCPDALDPDVSFAELGADFVVRDLYAAHVGPAFRSLRDPGQGKSSRCHLQVLQAPRPLHDGVGEGRDANVPIES